MSETNNNTRKELLSQKMGFNQMRNSIYWLQRYMRQSGLSDNKIKKRLESIGTNIGATFVMEIDNPKSELDALIKQLYYLTVNSKVKITQEGNLFLIKDTNSALSKYKYDDITVSGDTIIVAAVAEMLERVGYTVSEYKVEKCRSYGDKNSIHQYVIDKKGELL
jgi:hypothetical protein